MAQLYRTIKDGEEPKTEAIVEILKALGGFGETSLRTVGTIVEQVINLAKFNPQMVAVVGIIATNMASHKVDLIHWQHQEVICLDCAGLSLGPQNQVISSATGQTIGNVLANGFLSSVPGLVFQGIMSLGQFFASHSPPGTPSTPPPAGNNLHQSINVWVPGIIDSSASLIITGIIIASFGVSLTGSVLSDISQITKLSGPSSSSAPLVTSSVSTLVEQGSQIKTMQALSDIEKAT